MAKRQRSSVAVAAKRRLAEKAVTAAVEQYLGTSDPEMIAAAMADPDLVAAMAEFQAALMLLKMPNGTAH